MTAGPKARVPKRRRRPAALVRLVYVSAATRALSKRDLQDIAESSLRNNDPRDITGLLLYQGGQFYAIMEGDIRQVLGRMEHIITDRRHSAIGILREEEISARRFYNWSFACLPADRAGQETRIPGGFFLDLSRRLG